MYLKSLRLENIACFEELDLDFTDENGEPCKWVVLLGENGTGKSTILRMLASISMVFPNSRLDRGSRFLDLDMKSLIRNKNYKSVFLDKELRYEYIPELIGSMYSRVNIIVNNELPDYTLVISSTECYARSSDPSYFDNYYFGQDKAFLYGISKSLPPEKLRIHSDDRGNVKRFGRLFGYNEFENPSTWMNNLYYRSIHPQAKDSDKIIFNKVIEIIPKILPDVFFEEVNISGDVIVIDKGHRVLLDNLSDGYRNVSDWVFDLLRWLFEIFPENTFEAKGVVLIDEIDLHLHPRWQREVVQKIRNIFENLQFIVTTHSPFIVQDMTEKDKIIVLTREGDKVTAREEKGFVQDWRAGQILTSWLFGLPTDYDEKIEEKLGKQQELADRKAQGLLTDEEREELRQVTEFLSTLPSEETGAELLSQEHLDREAVRKAAATALKLLRKVEGK